MQYQLFLRNNKLNTYQLISNLMIALNAAGLFSYYFSYGLTKKIQVVFIGVLLINGIYLLVKISEGLSRRWPSEHWYRYVFIISSIAWFLSSWWGVGILLLLMALLDFYAKRPLVVLVNESGVQYPSVPVKTFSWKSLSNVVLKDGLLTIDQKNNKLIQQMTEDLGKETNEPAFNAFCRDQLNRPASGTA